MVANTWNHHTTRAGTAKVNTKVNTTWRLEMVRHDSGLHLTTFPMDTLTWRVAEYGFDLDDIDGILDVIIHEQFMQYDDELDADLPLLHASGSQQEAREAHLERIHRIKTQRTQVLQGVTAKAPHPFDIIRKWHGITQEGVEQKLGIIHQNKPNWDKPGKRKKHYEIAPFPTADENRTGRPAPKVTLKVIGSQ